MRRERQVETMTAFRRYVVVGCTALCLVAAVPAGAGTLRCPPDSVTVGTNCIDTYEASVWRVPDPTTTNKSLVAKIQQGRATAADLTKGGATQLGLVSGDYAPCAASGQNCVNDIYAVSLPAVLPSAFATWFQAQ